MSWIARGQAYREPVTPPEAPEREGHMDKNHPDRPLPSGRHSQRQCDPHSTWRPSQEGRPPPQMHRHPRTHSSLHTDSRTERQTDGCHTARRIQRPANAPIHMSRNSQKPRSGHTDREIHTYRMDMQTDTCTQIQTLEARTVKHTHKHIHRHTDRQEDQRHTRRCTGTERRTSDGLTRTEATDPSSETDQNTHWRQIGGERGRYEGEEALMRPCADPCPPGLGSPLHTRVPGHRYACVPKACSAGGLRQLFVD